MEQRARATRAVLRRHPWAVGLLDSRSHPGPATLAHHEWVVGRLREGGFSVARAAHAFAVLDSFVYGFALQEASMPFDSAEGPSPELAEQMGLHDLAGAFPYLAEMAGHALSDGLLLRLRVRRRPRARPRRARAAPGLASPGDV